MSPNKRRAASLQQLSAWRRGSAWLLQLAW